jgi:hypothetical protein
MQNRFKKCLFKINKKNCYQISVVYSSGYFMATLFEELWRSPVMIERGNSPASLVQWGNMGWKWSMAEGQANTGRVAKG